MQEPLFAFLDLVKKHFRFLTDDYGFKIIKESSGGLYSQEEDGSICYANETTFITMNAEMHSFSLGIGRMKDRNAPYLAMMALSTIYEYQTFHPEEKALLLSRNPADEDNLVGKNTSKKLGTPPRASTGNVVKDFENNLIDHATWLSQYAEPLMRGDFAQWLDLYDYMLGRMIADEVRGGMSEYYGRLENINGKLKKVSTFSRGLEYLENLQQEYGRRLPPVKPWDVLERLDRTLSEVASLLQEDESKGKFPVLGEIQLQVRVALQDPDKLEDPTFIEQVGQKIMNLYLERQKDSFSLYRIQKGNIPESYRVNAKFVYLKDELVRLAEALESHES
jgi:hypothetical protein